mgnify:CR=1 FL=1
MYDFEVIKAKSLTEAIELLKSEGAQVLGGGQTLIPTLKQRLASPNILISVAHIRELAGVTKTDENEIVIGGSTTHAEVNKKVKDFEALAKIENLLDSQDKSIFVSNQDLSRGDIILNCDGMHYSEKSKKTS